MFWFCANRNISDTHRRGFCLVDTRAGHQVRSLLGDQGRPIACGVHLSSVASKPRSENFNTILLSPVSEDILSLVDYSTFTEKTEALAMQMPDVHKNTCRPRPISVGRYPAARNLFGCPTVYGEGWMAD